MPQFLDITLLAHKTERDKVRAEFSAECNIDNVLFCQRRQIYMHAWQINMAPRAERGRSENFATKSILFLLEHDQLNQAVVHQNGVADADILDQSIVVDADRIFFRALRAAGSEFEDVAGF